METAPTRSSIIWAVALIGAMVAITMLAAYAVSAHAGAESVNSIVIKLFQSPGDGGAA
jgi:hypothetical protein